MKVESNVSVPGVTTKSALTPVPSGGVVQLRPHSDRKYTNPVRVLGASAHMVAAGSPDQRMAQVAATQRGRISHQQLLAVGMSCRMVRTRVRRGSLHVLHRAVYAVGHAGLVEFGDETAALLAYGPGAALSHRSAAWLWDFIREDPEEVHLILSTGATTKNRPGIYVHRSRTFSSAEVVIRKGLPVVKPALAVLQLAEYGPERELEKAVDEALAVRAVSRTKAAGGRWRCMEGAG